MLVSGITVACETGVAGHFTFDHDGDADSPPVPPPSSQTFILALIYRYGHHHLRF